MNRLAELLYELKNHVGETYDTLNKGSTGKNIRHDANALAKTLKSSFPMLEKDPQHVNAEDLINSGFGVMPLSTKLPATAFSKAHELAQKNAALPIEQGGLGLHDSNTAMERARAMGFDTNVYHASRKGDDIIEFGNRIEKTSMFNGLGVHSGTKDAAIQRADKSREVSMETGKLKDDQSVYYPLLIRSGKNPGAKDEYDSEFLLDRIGKEIKTNRDTQEGRKAIQQEFFNRYDSMPYINDVEDKGSISFISPPKNIRSRFAAFDPMQKNSANILASLLLGIGLAKDEK